MEVLKQATAMEVVSGTELRKQLVAMPLPPCSVFLLLVPAPARSANELTCLASVRCPCRTVTAGCAPAPRQGPCVRQACCGG